MRKPGLRYLILSAVVALLACGLLIQACPQENKELAQREAFKILLQKNILEKTGIRFPPLSEQQQKAVGPFASHYALLNSISEDEDLIGSFAVLPELQQKLMRTADPSKKQELINQAAAHMESIRGKLISAYKRTRRNKRTLKQPEDVQAIYDEAFLKVIQAPTDLLVDLIDQSLEAVEAATALNQYLLNNPGAATYRGSTMLIEKPEAEAAINELFEAYKEKSDRALQTVSELNNLTW